MPHTFSFVSRAAWSFLLLSVALASPLNQERSSNANCRKTQVAVLYVLLLFHLLIITPDQPRFHLHLFPSG